MIQTFFVKPAKTEKPDCPDWFKKVNTLVVLMLVSDLLLLLPSMFPKTAHEYFLIFLREKKENVGRILYAINSFASTVS